MAAPRVFVSHATPDADFAKRLCDDLGRLGADVWLDSSHMGSGDIVARISQALLERDVLVLVLSPSAIQSPWVTQEMSAAILRANQGLMRPPIVVMARFSAPNTIPPLWTVYHRHDATRDYAAALAGVVRELGLHVPQPQSQPSRPVQIPVSAPTTTPEGRPIGAVRRLGRWLSGPWPAYCFFAGNAIFLVSGIPDLFLYNFNSSLYYAPQLNSGVYGSTLATGFITVVIAYVAALVASLFWRQWSWLSTTSGWLVCLILMTFIGSRATYGSPVPPLASVIALCCAVGGVTTSAAFWYRRAMVKSPRRPRLPWIAWSFIAGDAIFALAAIPALFLFISDNLGKFDASDMQLLNVIYEVVFVAGYSLAIVGYLVAFITSLISRRWVWPGLMVGWLIGMIAMIFVASRFFYASFDGLDSPPWRWFGMFALCCVVGAVVTNAVFWYKRARARSSP